MLQNLSICTGFRLFRNSNVLTALENIANVVANHVSTVVPLLETVTENLNLVMKNQKAR